MTSLALARLYYAVRRLFERAQRLEASLFTGFWLGALGRSALNAVDDLYYVGGEGQRFGPIDYHAESYNRMGFWNFEKAVIDNWFQTPTSIVVLAAGGGREVLALRKLGFAADGWECQPSLVEAANRLLVQEGFPPSVEEVPRDTCPPGEARYGAAIVGWGAYTLIQGRARRVRLMRQLRDRLCDGAPVLLSFFARSPAERRFRMVAGTANVARRLTLREPVEVGDYLEPNYVHYFTVAELRSELEEAGFTLEAFEPRPYGHAVARAGSASP